MPPAYYGPPNPDSTGLYNTNPKPAATIPGTGNDPPVPGTGAYNRYQSSSSRTSANHAQWLNNVRQWASTVNIDQLKANILADPTRGTVNDETVAAELVRDMLNNTGADQYLSGMARDYMSENLGTRLAGQAGFENFGRGYQTNYGGQSGYAPVALQNMLGVSDPSLSAHTYGTGVAADDANQRAARAAATAYMAEAAPVGRYGPTASQANELLNRIRVTSIRGAMNNDWNANYQNMYTQERATMGPMMEYNALVQYIDATNSGTWANYLKQKLRAAYLEYTGTEDRAPTFLQGLRADQSAFLPVSFRRQLGLT